MTTHNPAGAKTPADMAATFRRLEGLLRRCERDGLNKHDQVITLVAACLVEGIDTGEHIIGTIASFGFNHRHIGKLLRDNIGHLWHRDGKGTYSILPPLE